ncbi:MAG: hypothetical protein IPJ02_08425 [Chitinophagaceae bacterium]|nr:hypothetical protein [Chitinophagaceae bacterium]
MTKYFIPLLLTAYFISCDNSETSRNKENEPDIPKHLTQATLSYLDTLFEQGTSVSIKFTTRLDSNIFSILSKWTSYNEAKIGKDDKWLFSKLLQSNFNSLYLSSGDTTFLKGQIGIKSYVQVNFGGLSFNEDTTKMATVLAVLFGEEIKSGWQEVIVYKKIGNRWAINKRNMILEY